MRRPVDEVRDVARLHVREGENLVRYVRLEEAPRRIVGGRRDLRDPGSAGRFGQQDRIGERPPDVHPNPVSDS